MYLLFRSLNSYDVLRLFTTTTTTTTMTVMAITQTVATTPATIAVVGISVTDAHSGSLREEMRTGHMESMFRINPSTVIETPLDVHCWI